MALQGVVERTRPQLPPLPAVALVDVEKDNEAAAWLIGLGLTIRVQRTPGACAGTGGGEGLLTGLRPAVFRSIGDR